VGGIDPDELREDLARQLIVLRGRVGSCREIGGAGESRNGAKEGQPQGEFIDSSSQGHRPLQRLTYRGRTALRRLAIGVAGYWCRRRRLRTRLIARVWVVSLVSFLAIEIYAFPTASAGI
jgi:hypothetical protein